MNQPDYPNNEHCTPIVRTLRLEGRDFGYHSANIGLWDTVFLWVGLKRWLSAWAFGFEIIAGSVLIFVGPLVFGIGLIKLARFIEERRTQ